MMGEILAERYAIEAELGHGGMAVVYKGQDLLLNRPVAIKVLREQYSRDESFVRRFRREAQAVAALSHPNIVSIYDVGRDNSRHYLVMEYIEGTNLKDIIEQRGPLPPEKVIDIALEICEALDHAHEKKIIHRDIKPHNIIITPKGTVKVTDFGIAQALSAATITYGGVVGSVQYIAPEQAQGAPTGPPADIYSLGAVMYEMLTGQPPFSGETPVSVALKHLHEDPQPVSELAPEVPPILEQIVMKALSKQPADRQPGARALYRELLTAKELLDNEENTAVLAIGRPKRRGLKSLLLPGAIVLALVLVGAGAWLAWNSFFSNPEVIVPNVIRKPLSVAEQILTEAGLKPALGTRRSHPEIPEGYVIAQSVEPNTKVKRGRVVYLDVSLGPNLVTVPDVAGLEKSEAERRLAELGFRVEENTIADPVAPAGRVIRTEPPAQSSQPKGSRVTLIISAGPPPQLIAMPDLRGMTLEDARQALAANKLVLGTVTYEEQPNYQYLPGQVCRQSIAPNSPINQGSTVNLTLSRGPGPVPRSATAEVVVPNDGRNHRIRIIVADVTGTKEVYNDIHSPGDKVKVRLNYYGQGKAQIYQDDKLVHEETLGNE